MSIVAAVTMQSTVVCLIRSVTLTLKIVAQPKDGTGPKLVAKRFAKKVNRLLATAGAGEVALLNRASLLAMKSADWAYC